MSRLFFMAEVVVEPLGGLITLWNKPIQSHLPAVNLWIQLWQSKTATGGCEQQHVVTQHLLYAAHSSPTEASQAAHTCAVLFLMLHFYVSCMRRAEKFEIGGLCRSAVVEPMLRAEGNRAAEGHDVCCYCMRVHFYGFNYRLQTQTDLFILLCSIHWGLVGTTNTRATHTHIALYSNDLSLTAQQVVPASWVSHLYFMSMSV